MENCVEAIDWSTDAIPGVSLAVKAAAEAADDVDRRSRFPSEAIEALRDAKLLSCSLPRRLGGASYGIAQLAAVARALGSGCSSAAMVFAMHHIQAMSLTRHGQSSPIEELIAKIAAQESLLASATTEITTGGDVRSSTCAIVIDGDNVILEKDAPVISYAEDADYIFTTARRGPDSPPTDQVLLVCPAGDTTLEKTTSWDVMGFRGTCSPGYILRTRTSRANLIPAEYATISGATMLPAAHTLWSAVWLGIADAAMSKARNATREAVRRAGGKPIPQAAKLAELTLVHQNFESMVTGEVVRFCEFADRGRSEPTIGFTIAMNNLKLASSLAVVEVAVGALQLIGISGYREDHPNSMSRLIRDCFAPQLMVSNDRIRTNNAQLILAHRE